MVNLNEEIEIKRNLYSKHLSRIRNLPSIPSLMLEVSRLLEDPRTSATELGRLISRDQAMVAKVLMVANSPLYGIPRKVSTVEFAIVILGFNHIKNIVVALSVMNAFQSTNKRKWNRSKFWAHSIAMGVLSKRIAGDLGFGRTGEAFTAGLLHDLGISAIQRYFPNEFNNINKLVEIENIRHITAEKMTMGLTHAEIGQFLINNWNLPENLANAVRYHHEPSEAQEETILPSIIHLADFMTQKFRNGDFDWDENLEFDQGIINNLSLGDPVYLNSFIDSYKELFTEHINSIQLF
ncbi:MAG TPA: HDOD domain-containing protein [Ignavibacteria bacterium]|nr:HDOD domain-containing protein [Ignavibacteria bacterium]